jgi:hypothetical protein
VFNEREIIECIEDRQSQAIQLSLDERDYVAETLREAWLPKRELRAHRRRQRLQNAEAATFLLKNFESQNFESLSADERGDLVATFCGFPNRRAMAQFIKRERAARRNR